MLGGLREARGERKMKRSTNRHAIDVRKPVDFLTRQSDKLGCTLWENTNKIGYIIGQQALLRSLAVGTVCTSLFLEESATLGVRGQQRRGNIFHTFFGKESISF